MKERPAAAATAVLYDGLSTELLAAYADEATGALHTLQFQETRADTGEVERLLQFDWERTAPAGASIVLPEAGQPLVRLDEYWLMWSSGNLLMAQSAHRAAPLVSRIADGEWIVDRPLVTAAQELHAYGWREGRLIRHRYPAGSDAGGVARIETVMELDARPARSVCVPLPGDTGGTAVIGFVEESENGIQASVAYVREGKALQLDGAPEGRYRLMKRHKMALHAGKKARPAMAMITESPEDGSYALLEARFDFGAKSCVWNRTRLEAARPGELASAAVFYYKTQDAPEPFVLAVPASGHLVALGKRTAQVLREDAGPDYGYPVVTTMTKRYEVTGAGAEMKMERL